MKAHVACQEQRQTDALTLGNNFWPTLCTDKWNYVFSTSSELDIFIKIYEKVKCFFVIVQIDCLRYGIWIYVITLIVMLWFIFSPILGEAKVFRVAPCYFFKLILDWAYRWAWSWVLFWRWKSFNVATYRRECCVAVHVFLQVSQKLSPLS